MRALRTSTDMGGIDPGNAQSGCYGRRGDVSKQWLNPVYERLGGQPIWEAGRKRRGG